MTLTLIGLLTDILSSTFNAVSRAETIPLLWILLFKPVTGICPGPVPYYTEAVGKADKSENQWVLAKGRKKINYYDHIKHYNRIRHRHTGPHLKVSLWNKWNRSDSLVKQRRGMSISRKLNSLYLTARITKKQVANIMANVYKNKNYLVAFQTIKVVACQ